jgi:DNA invertase Pin-like site-specific DNA recombinase
VGQWIKPETARQPGDRRPGADRPPLIEGPPHGELILTIMGGMAEFERKLIRARCDDGIKRAKARGTVFGRKPALDHGERRKIAERYAAGETMQQLATEYEVGVGTIHRVLKPAS